MHYLHDEDSLALQTALLQRDEETEQVVFQPNAVKFWGGADPALEINNELYRFTDGSFRQLSEALRIPVPYARRIDNELLEHTFNHMLHTQPATETMAALLNTEAKAVRSFMDPSLPYVPSHRMLDITLEHFGRDASVKEASVTDTLVSFVVCPDDNMVEVGGSPLFGGLKVGHSDSWGRGNKFETYLWRQICSNGMVAEVDSRQFRLSGKTEGEILRQTEDFVELAAQQIPAMFESYLALQQHKVENALNTIRCICQTHKLSNKIQNILFDTAEQQAFLMTLPNGQLETMHDIINLFTWVGSHNMELSEDIRQQLLVLAGRITLDDDARRDPCGRPL